MCSTWGVGWNNPDVPWSTLEAVLSGRDGSSLPGGHGREGGREGGDGGDSPAWSRKRDRYQPPPLPDPESRVPYAELHCHSNFSFLDGASPPEELVEEAKRLGLDALALTDHDGMYGVVRFAEAAAELGVDTVFGAELSLGLSAPQNGVADPEGTHLLLLARDPEGYRGALPHRSAPPSCAGEEKGRPVYDVDELVGAHRWPRARALRLPQGRRCGRRCAPAGGDAAARELAPTARVVRGRARGRRAHPRGAAHRHRDERRARRARRRRRPADRGHHRGALRRPGSGTRWPRHWPRCARGAASTTPTAGSRRPAPPTCAPARR